MNQLLKAYNTCNRLPFGKTVFSSALCFKAPYFRTIKPRFVELRPGYCEISMKKRWGITNHIKSVHAIAMCNISELAAGTVLEVSIPKTMRWIPKGMSVKYLQIAKSDLTAKCEIKDVNLEKTGELPLTVHVTDKNGQEVFQAVITMHISAKKSK